MSSFSLNFWDMVGERGLAVVLYFFLVCYHFLKICVVFSVCTLAGNPSPLQIGQFGVAASQTARAVSRFVHPAGTPSWRGKGST